jgi:hypothetical protein
VTRPGAVNAARAGDNIRIAHELRRADLMQPTTEQFVKTYLELGGEPSGEIYELVRFAWEQSGRTEEIDLFLRAVFDAVDIPPARGG